MRKFSIIFVIFTIWNLALFTNVIAAPQSADTSSNELSNLTESVVTTVEEEEEVPVKYDGAQLWRVDFADARSKQIVIGLQKEFEVSMWGTNGSAVDLFLKKSAVDGGAGRILNEANIRYSIVIDNMQKEIDAENPKPEEIEVLQNRKGHRLTWSAYHRVSDIYSYLDYLAATYPDLCSVQTIGYSIEKRPLRVLRISNGKSSNKAIWIDGGIHAREWISPASVTFIINNLVEKWDDQPTYIQSIDWFILPVVNPDGYEYTHRADRLWRKNRNTATGSNRCAGVDLNRNYGHKWGGKGTSKQPCSEIFAGKRAFSEPETLAMKEFFDRKKERFFAFLTFHSYGQYILYPWGYDDVVPPDYQDLDRVGKLAASNMKSIDQQVYAVGSSSKLLYPAAGGSDDWAKSIGIKYSYTVELRDGGRFGFVLPAYLIKTTAQEAEEFVFTVARAVASLKRKE